MSLSENSLTLHVGMVNTFFIPLSVIDVGFPRVTREASLPPNTIWASSPRKSSSLLGMLWPQISLLPNLENLSGQQTQATKCIQNLLRGTLSCILIKKKELSIDSNMKEPLLLIKHIKVRIKLQWFGSWELCFFFPELLWHH